jgi:hypothetical protein
MAADMIRGRGLECESEEVGGVTPEDALNSFLPTSLDIHVL